MPAEKHLEPVLALLRKEEPAAQIARRAGISEPALHRWRDEFIAGGKAQLGGKGHEALPHRLQRAPAP
nr:helix-turn-helix domain-containing protein [Rehaibacterium terrae]